MSKQTPNQWAYFDAAYKKACESSQPDDWMQAALLAQQIRYTAPELYSLAVKKG